MLEVYENASSNQSLPFPCLVNRLVTSSCLPSIDGEAAIDLHGSIGLHSISMSEAQLRKRKSASASAEVPSSSQAQMSSENTQRAENPPLSTSVPLSDTPSPNTLHKVFTFLVDSINLHTERSDVLICKIDMLNNDSVQIKSQLKRIQEHLGITTAEPSAPPPSIHLLPDDWILHPVTLLPLLVPVMPLAVKIGVGWIFP
ncbi:hypothetical protein CJ030_MR3G015170 [Morella rubra]|uniref:Uncharacterized protein n=1 Tax=Morella rubra TaxID=262757 RepID=A0A6A1W0Y9_9ROSI|nr:hypothetical protein CJ030_MR3G015170 [Morella rubra]